eukprot:1368549-Pyramimonas_sp.AAC.1
MRDRLAVTDRVLPQPTRAAHQMTVATGQYSHEYWMDLRRIDKLRKQLAKKGYNTYPLPGECEKRDTVHEVQENLHKDFASLGPSTPL